MLLMVRSCEVHLPGVEPSPVKNPTAPFNLHTPQEDTWPHQREGFGVIHLGRAALHPQPVLESAHFHSLLEQGPKSLTRGEVQYYANLKDGMSWLVRLLCVSGDFQPEVMPMHQVKGNV